MKIKAKVGKLLEIISPIIDVSVKGGQKDFSGFGILKIESFKKDDSINLLTYNGAIAIKGKISNLNVNDLFLEVDEEGSVLVDAKYLSGALSSFPTDTTVIFEYLGDKNSKELYIKDAKDVDQYQSIPCYNQDFTYPKEDTKIYKEFKIKTDVFVSGVKRTSFAYGFQQDMNKFLYWIFRIKEKSVRFASGTGSLFAILDVEGDGVVDVVSPKDKEFNIMFLNSHMSVITNLLGKVKDDEVVIKETDRSDCDHLIIDSNLYTITMVGIHPTQGWPNEQTLLDLPIGAKLVISSEDLDYACKGIAATHTQDMVKTDQEHKVFLHYSNKNDYMELKSDYALRALRKVSVKDSELDDNKEIKSATYSENIIETSKVAGKEGNIQIELPKKTGKQPIIIYLYAGDKVGNKDKLLSTNAATGFSEKFAIMFVQISVEDEG